MPFVVKRTFNATPTERLQQPQCSLVVHLNRPGKNIPGSGQLQIASKEYIINIINKSNHIAQLAFFHTRFQLGNSYELETPIAFTVQQ